MDEFNGSGTQSADPARKRVMGKSSSVKEEGSAHGRSRSFDDVEGSLHRPLMDELNGSGTPSAAPDEGYVKKLLRGHSAPTLDKPVPDHVHPPYHNTEFSVLSKALFGLAIYFAVGILCYYFFNQDLFGIKTMSFVDALYFCVVTLTTVGYGDLVPGTTIGKFFTCTYFLVGFVLVGGLVSGAADYLVQKQEVILIHAIKKKEKPGFDQTEEGHLEAATFKVYVSGSLLALTMVVGTIFMMAVEKKNLVDAFYCVMVTATTLGYGDHTFQTASGRLFAAVWILAGTVFLAQFLLYVAEMGAVKRQLKLAHWVLHRKTTRPDLEAADLDGDGFVSASEFVIFKLKELGKVDEEDVLEILRDFQAIDYDRTGQIKIGDARLDRQSEEQSK